MATALCARRPRLQRALSAIGAFALLVVALLLGALVGQSGPMVLQVGSWDAPLGITLLADHLSVAMLVLTGLIGTAVAVYSYAKPSAEGAGERHFHIAAGRVVSHAPPLVAEGASAPAGAVANPLPQALVLTAIVIGFGLAAFLLALLARASDTAERS